MKAILLAVAAGLCRGVGEVFTKSVLHGGRIGPLTAVAVRSTVALPILWLACAAATRVGRSEPGGWLEAGTPTLLELTLGSGLLAGAAGMVLFYAALGLDEISSIKPSAFTIAPATGAVLACWLWAKP